MDDEILEGEKCETTASASYYDGDLLTNWFFSVVSFFCRTLTLDVAAPIVVCLRLRWRAEHTHLNGRRMIFTGKIRDLFAKNALWVLLSVVTLGVYVPFKMLKMAKWETAHFHFVGVPESNYDVEKSELDFKWYAYFGLNVLSFLGNLLTLGIAQYWLFVLKERKVTEHTRIDGHALEFHATAGNYFKKKVLWAIYTALSLGIYTIFLKGKLLRWKISNTHVLSPETMIFVEEVAASQPTHPANTRAYVAFFLFFPTAIFLAGAWAAKVLCVHGPQNFVSYVPLILLFAAAVLTVLSMIMAAKAYQFSLKVYSAKHLSIFLIVLYSLLSLLCIAILVALLILLL